VYGSRQGPSIGFGCVTDDGFKLEIDVVFDDGAQAVPGQFDLAMPNVRAAVQVTFTAPDLFVYRSASWQHTKAVSSGTITLQHSCQQGDCPVVLSNVVLSLDPGYPGTSAHNSALTIPTATLR
jgi:hypothetical protein